MKTTNIIVAVVIANCLLPIANCFSQNIGISTTSATPNASALLDVDASPGNNKGLLIPRVTFAQRTGINFNPLPAAAQSLLVYQTDAGGDGQGYYYNTSTTTTPAWEKLFSVTTGWSLTGNASTVDGTNFIGTTDNIPFNIRVNNQKAGRIDNTLGNTFWGYQAGNANTTGYWNTASGWQALYSNTTGNENTASGWQTLYSNTTGNSNTANGLHALYFNVAGSNGVAIGIHSQAYANNTATAWDNTNTSVGYQSLRGSTTPANNTGINNTAIGRDALLSNTTGNNNTANGYAALSSNTTGIYNTAIGWQTLLSNTGGSYNIALGYQALQSNSSGSENSALGGNALINNTIGNSNIAIGAASLRDNITGSTNTALGYYAGVYGTSHNQCVFIGGNTALNTNRTNVTAIGYAISEGFCTGDNQVLLGNGAIVQIRASVTGITAYSDARFKTNIKENIVGLDFILKLKPVTYNVRPAELHKIWGTPDSLVSKIDHSEAEKETRIGFVAQDVEKAAQESGFSFPGIDVPRNEHEVYTLRYVDFIMPMVKAIQELKMENDSLKSENETLKAANNKQQTTNTELKAEIEKIKQYLELKAGK